MYTIHMYCQFNIPKLSDIYEKKTMYIASFPLEETRYDHPNRHNSGERDDKEG